MQGCKPLSGKGTQTGMTLIEILVVLVILGLVGGFLISKISGGGDKAKVSLTKLKMEQIKSDIDQYRLMYNALPGSLDDLTQCNDRTGPGCVPAYDAQSDALFDAWGSKFNYLLENNNRTFKISSFGADGVSGGQGVDFDLFVTGP